MKPERVQEMPQEQAAELAALEAQAGAAVENQPGQTGGTAAPVAHDLAAELKALTLAFVGMAAPILPSLATIYTEETTAAAAQAVASVCNKYGWLQGGLMGDYGEEIAAAVVLLPVAIATYRGVSGDLAAMKKKPERAAAQIGADTGAATVSDTGAINQKTVVFGAPIPAAETESAGSGNG